MLTTGRQKNAIIDKFQSLATEQDTRPDIQLEEIFTDLTTQNKWNLFQDEKDSKRLIEVILENIKCVVKSMDVLVDERDLKALKNREISKQKGDL
jgi:hypothetical protein